MNPTNYTPLFCGVLVFVYSTNLCIESKTMNDYNVKNTIQSSWLDSIKLMTAKKKSGQYHAQDKNGMPITIEWHITDILSPELATFKKNVSDLSAQVTAAIETELLHQRPEAVHTSRFFKACEPLLTQGSDQVNWQTVEETIKTSIKQFYLMDMTKFGQEVIRMLINDVYFFASVKDQKTNTLLGCIMSSITPALPYGDIKIINIAIKRSEQMNGLEKLLISALYKTIPTIKRMFIITRPTNSIGLGAYEQCGFAQDNNPIQDPNHVLAMEHFVVLEYKTEQSETIQNTANKLIE